MMEKKPRISGPTLFKSVIQGSAVYRSTTEHLLAVGLQTYCSIFFIFSVNSIVFSVLQKYYLCVVLAAFLL